MRSLCLKTLLIVVCIVHCTLATQNEDQSLPRTDFHASSSSSAQSYAIIKRKYDYTKTDIIKSWTENMSPLRPVYSKEFVLKVVGKTGEVKTKNSSFIHVFLENDDTVFRLTVWKNYFQRAFNKLKLNNVVKMNKVQLKIFYGRQLLDNLEKTFEFIVAMYSTIDVIEEGQLEEYPAQNLYPPYWKHIKNMRHGDKDLALRAMILDQPRNFSVKNGTEEKNGILLIVGDQSNYKIQCFIPFDENTDQDEITKIKKDVGLLLSSGEVVQFVDGTACLMINGFSYLKIEEQHKILEKENNYAWLELTYDEPSVPPPSPPPAKKLAFHFSKFAAQSSFKLTIQLK